MQILENFKSIFLQVFAAHSCSLFSQNRSKEINTKAHLSYKSINLIGRERHFYGDECALLLCVIIDMKMLKLIQEKKHKQEIKLKNLY